MLVKIAMPVRTIRQKVPLPRLLVRTAALLNFQPSSLPLPNPIAKIVPLECIKRPLDKAVVFKTCVPVIRGGLLQQVLIVLQMILTNAAAALREKSCHQQCVKNVLPVKLPLDLLQRAMLALRVNTKTKMAQEQNTVVKIVVPEHTATKPNKVLHHRARIVSRDDGRPRPAMASVLVLLGALPVTKAHTTRWPHKVPTRVPIVAKASTTM